MNLSLIVAGAILAQGLVVTASNGATPVQTNFVSGVTLSVSELNAVVVLASICGITDVTRVSTARHLSGDSIEVRGDEKIDARRVLFKTLLVRCVGWPGGKLPPKAIRSIGEFWVEASTRPQEDERTIVRVDNRTFWVGLLNGIKPEGTDKVIGAFVNGRVRYDSDSLKDRVSNIDFTQPTWLGISGGKCWISFSSPGPQRRIIFQLNGSDVTILDVISYFE